MPHCPHKDLLMKPKLEHKRVERLEEQGLSISIYRRATSEPYLHIVYRRAIADLLHAPDAQLLERRVRLALEHVVPGGHYHHILEGGKQGPSFHRISNWNHISCCIPHLFDKAPLGETKKL